MADPKSDGRMIRKDISNSDRFAALSPQAAVLFAMLIPHYNTWGKMNGGPGFVKDEVCPKVPYLTYENIPEYLAEIHEKTNVKWFMHDGRHWLHSLNFLTEHQKITIKKVGRDLLPTYSGTSPGLSPEKVPLEVEVEVEVEGEEEEEGESGLALEKECKKTDPCSIPSADSDPPPEPYALVEHEWQTLVGIFPPRSGKIHDIAECKLKFLSMEHPRRQQVIIGAGHYAESREVADGAVMHLMKFLDGKFRNWQLPEEKPLGHSPPKDDAWKREYEQGEREMEKTELGKARAQPKWRQEVPTSTPTP